jgi:hemolysin III
MGCATYGERGAFRRKSLSRPYGAVRRTVRSCQMIRDATLVPSGSVSGERRYSDSFTQLNGGAQLDGDVPSYTRAEEVIHWLSHGIGALLSLVGLTMLMVLAKERGDVWYQVSFAVFGVGLVGTYLVSTCYHFIQDPVRRSFFRRLDHAAIFVLIAATYTPFLLTRLRGPWGWTLMAVVWTACGLGAGYKLAGKRTSRLASTCTYVALGWLILIAVKPMVASVSLRSLWLLLAGGVFYTSGVVFYLRHSMRYHHAIWHGFVLAGSACHFLAVLALLSPH